MISKAVIPFFAAGLLAVPVQASFHEDPPTDIARLCEDAGYSSIAGYFSPSETELIRKGSAAEIRSALGSSDKLTPWYLAMAPRYAARRAAYQIQMELAAYSAGVSNPDALLKLLEETAKRPAKTPYSEEALAIARDFPKRWAHWETGFPVSETRKKLIPLICLRHGSVACVKQMETLIRILDPKVSPSSALAMNPALFVRFLSQAEYLPGAARAALRVHARILAADRGRKQRAFVLDDLTESYLETGLPQAESSGRAWDLLGFYGSRGASIYQLVPNVSHLENRPLYAALMIIASGIEALDAASLPSAPYAYPPGSQTTCAYGKAYHFWMSAYLAHTLTVTRAVDAPVRASYIWGTLYEMFANIQQRRAGTVLLEPLYSVKANSVRLNLASNGLGASFGGSSGMIGKGDLDAVIRRLLLSAKPIDPLTPREVDRLMDEDPVQYGKIWEQMLAPYSIFEARR